MGLDMYAFTAKPDRIANPVEIDLDTLPDVTQIYAWRKHPNLHGWMAERYYAKGGTKDCFNCVPVQLSREDLDELEEAIRAGNLPPTSGFFFGESDGSEQQGDLDFIARARAAIAEGRAVIYDSWW